MRNILLTAVLLGSFLSLGNSTARADTAVFDITGKFADSGIGTSLIGTVTIDTTAGTILATDVSTTGNFPGGPYPLVSASGNPVNLAFNGTGGSIVLMQLYLPVSSLVGYAGGVLCSNDTFASSLAGCSNQISFYQLGSAAEDLVSGSLTPTAAAEPSSMCLLGTGLLSLGLLVRRRAPAA
jgi:hypothetical protein